MKYRVTAKKGNLVVVTPESGGEAVGVREERADLLAERLGVSDQELVGISYECDVEVDSWGITFSNYRLSSNL